MLQRLVKDESGVALGLAVIMIALIGVMGAGLLVFVRNDLEAVVEVNQGQRAFNVADAGVQAAKQHLLGDKTPAHYDVDSAGDSDYISAGCNIAEADEATAPVRVGEDWSPEGAKWPPEVTGAEGVTRNFTDGQFNVTIRWLNPDSSVDDRCKAPQTGTLPEGEDYFEVISTGTYGDATRRIEAIYSTYDLNAPRAYFTPDDITISGNANIQNASLFTLGDISIGGGTVISGEDLAYGDWNRPPFNTTARPTTVAGLGAAGQIRSSSSLGTKDFDVDSTPIRFIRKTNPETDPQTASQVTFPFNITNQPDADRLCDQARATGSYTADNTSGNATLNSWPSNSSSNTVVCYEFTNTGSNHTLTWGVSGSADLGSPYSNNPSYDRCGGPVRQGTLIIKGGNFDIKPRTALFAGVVVVRGTNAASTLGNDSTTDGEATLTGNVCMDGFVNSTGAITIRGTVTPAVSETTVDRPGFYGVRTWSWRELYE